MRQNKQTATTGDVFKMSVDDMRVGYGQVLHAGKHDLYVAVFKDIFLCNEAPDVEVLSKGDILLLATTTDARIWHGLWPIVGRAEPQLEQMSLPYYKIGQPPNCYIEDFEGNRVRAASPEDQAFYDFRLSVSPMRLENALKAYHGLLEWTSDFEKLTYVYVRARSSL